MPELSNLLKSGLARASQEAGVRLPGVHTDAHPDADVLTAFSEQSLPADERDQLMVHLAACGECRDVVYLMTEPLGEETAAPVMVAIPRRRWFLTPQFGFVAAVAAMAVGIGIYMRVQPNITNQPSHEARLNAPAASGSNEKNTVPANPDTTTPAMAAGAANPTSNAPSALTSNQTSNQKTADNLAPANGAVAASAVPQSNTGLKGADLRSIASNNSATNSNDALKKKSVAEPVEMASAKPARRDYVNLEMFSSDAADQGQSGDLPSAPPPQVSVTNLTQARNQADHGQPMVFADIPNNAIKQSQNGGMALFQPPSARQNTGIEGKIVDLGRNFGKRLHNKRLAPAIPQEVTTTFAMATNAPALDQSAEALAAAPTQKADASALRDSSAFMARGRAAGPAAATARLESASPAWKVDGGKLYRSINASEWTEFPAAPGVELSVVVAKGNEVWAGGAHATVVHSANHGTTWEKIALGDGASGTVLNIDVNGITVVVKTSAGQTWTSRDGGQSWVAVN